MVGRLWIFEGPDGSGKTTAAKLVAERTEALYVHMGAFPEVPAHASLVRTYAEAMMPALCREADVVLDRCWISEVPYGEAFRGGADRVGLNGRLALFEIAGSCNAIFIAALPPREVAWSNFIDRKDSEYLDTVEQFKQVYDWYKAFFNPRNQYERFYGNYVKYWDYTRQPIEEMIDL